MCLAQGPVVYVGGCLVQFFLLEVLSILSSLAVVTLLIVFVFLC